MGHPGCRDTELVALADLVLLQDGGELGLGHCDYLASLPPRASPPRPDEAEDHRVHQSLPGGLDYVLRDADGRPAAFCVCGVQEHPRDGVGPLGGVEHTDPVVGQMHVAQLGEVRLDGKTEGGVEGIDRPVALRCRNDTLVAHMGFDGRLGRELARRGPGMDQPGGIVFACGLRGAVPGAPVGDDPERLDPEQVVRDDLRGAWPQPASTARATRRPPRSGSRCARGA